MWTQELRNSIDLLLFVDESLDEVTFDFEQFQHLQFVLKSGVIFMVRLILSNTSLEFWYHFLKLVDFGLLDANLAISIEKVKVLNLVEEQRPDVHEFDPVMFLLRWPNEPVIPNLFKSPKLSLISFVVLYGLLFFREFLVEFKYLFVHKFNVDQFLQFEQLLQLDQLFGGFAWRCEVDKLGNFFVDWLAGLNDVGKGFGVILLFDVDDCVPEAFGLRVFLQVHWVLFD